MKRIILIATCLLALGYMKAQTYTLSGTMVDSLNKNKIFYATIGLMTQDAEPKMVANTYSDAEGHFVLEHVPAGTYNLKASLVGYELLTMPITVEGGSRSMDLGNIAMLKNSNALEEVSIKGERPVYMMDGEKTMYNVSEDPTIQSGTAADALQNAPGVEVDAEGNITLRGVSSVEIWLNNKPSNMNEEALKQFIKQMPAGSIEKIEVITNPSARYSAQGSGGVINIVTTSKIKKNSFVSFGVRGSSSPDVTPFVSYVYANEKFSFSAYMNYSYRVNKSSSESSVYMINDARDTTSITHSINNQRKSNHNPGLFLNANYTLDSMNTFGFWGGTYPSFETQYSYSRANWNEFIYNPGNYSYGDTTSGKQNSVGGYAGMWYEHKFNNLGHSLSFSVSYWGWGMKSQSDEFRNYLIMSGLNKDKKVDYRYRTNSVNVNMDYTIPYHENGEIELGVSGGTSMTNRMGRIDTLIVGSSGEYTLDSLRSQFQNGLDGDFAAYATIQHRFGNFTIKGGLRTEYENYGLRYLYYPQYDANKEYWGFFPSIHLSYRTKSMHNFKLSYTRRVSNPSADKLTLYRSYSEDSYSVGNPDLRQAYTNSVEAGWTKFFNKFGNVGVNAYFKNTKDEFSNMTDVAYDPYFGRIVTFSKPLNAGKTLNTGAELNVMYRLKAFMNIRFYANMYYMKSSFQFRDSENPHVVDNLGYSFRLNFWAKAWNVLEINASANYHSKSVTMFSVEKPRYSIDCGLRTEFWKRRISVFLNVNDIFNWNKWTTDENSPYVVSTSTFRSSWMGRSIRAGIEFKFGKMELESAQARQQGGGM